MYHKSLFYLILPIVLFAFVMTYPTASNAKSSPFDKDNSKKPIEITADSLEVIQPNKTATFSGNVLAIQGDMKISSNKMTVHYKDSKDKKEAGDKGGSISRIDVEGNVLLTTPEETARGVKGIYDVDEKHLLLVGDVVLTRGDNVLKGERLKYNMVTGRSVITAAQVTKDGKTKKGRVRAVFKPKNDDKAQNIDKSKNNQDSEKTKNPENKDKK